MNLFILHEDPVIAAQMQCDKHVPKMIVESGQMLSTAHRVLDGILDRRPSKSGKTRVRYWDLYLGRDDLEGELLLYKAVHVGHPCTQWTMRTSANYDWHYEHFIALAQEYTYRYGKDHKTAVDLGAALYNKPDNLPPGPLTPFELAMGANPECMIKGDPVQSYRLFYQTKQERFKMVWTKRNRPEWFNNVHSDG
jgi:hypothetical protein